MSSFPPKVRVHKFDENLNFVWSTWAAMSLWSIEEALCIFSSPDPHAILLQLPIGTARWSRPIEDLIKTHVDHGMWDVFSRAVAAGDVSNPDSPARWIELARRFPNIEVPPELVDAMRREDPAPPRATRPTVCASDNNIKPELVGPTMESRNPPHAVRTSVRVPDSAVEAWFRERMDNGEASTEEHDWDAARKHFEHKVTRTQLRPIRTRLLPPEKRKQGRRRTSPL
jgi:hypothetical protein